MARGTLNFTGTPVTVTDDVANDRINVAIAHAATQLAGTGGVTIGVRTSGNGSRENLTAGVTWDLQTTVVGTVLPVMTLFATVILVPASGSNIPLTLTNMSIGSTIYLDCQQDTVGNRTISFASLNGTANPTVRQQGQTPITTGAAITTLSTAASTKDRVIITMIRANQLDVAVQQNWGL